MQCNADCLLQTAYCRLSIRLYILAMCTSECILHAIVAYDSRRCLSRYSSSDLLEPLVVIAYPSAVPSQMLHI
jgi:hypothetical protein